MKRFSFFLFTVDECKKRWRSLRDAFMKQYKLYSRGDSNSKKRWLFYEQMEFLGPYFDKLVFITGFFDNFFDLKLF